MKIHGICLAKNEGDLMEHSLRDKLGWCDFIYIFDNGSTDATWEIARSFAAAEPQRVILFGTDPAPFKDGLRSAVFNRFRTRAERGDWWCRADVDEFYAVDPREFLADVPRLHHVVWSLHIQYLFTEIDMARWDATGECRIPKDLPRYYIANYSEPRFFRHRPGLVWHADDSWPVHLGLATPRRIPVRHYQFRSPPQIERRLATRREAAASGWQHFPHSLAENWREKIDPSSELHLDGGDGKFIIDEKALPRHIDPPARRAAKMLAHTFGIWP